MTLTATPSPGVTVAALYVQADGCYVGLPDVDPWPEARDARKYAGPHRVCAHPPCARWCRLAALVESRGGPMRGDDGGCFAAALASVRAWGGVLEHPAWSDAWPCFGLLEPTYGAWTRSLYRAREWVTAVDQHWYGHRAPKPTWLLYVGDTPPASLDPRRAAVTGVWTSWASTRTRPPGVQVMGKRERSATPAAFRDVLLSIARTP